MFLKGVCDKVLSITTAFQLFIHGISCYKKSQIVHQITRWCATIRSHVTLDVSRILLLGTSGTVGYFVEGQGDQMFVVMWSVPYDHTLYSNWLAVGVRKGNHDEGNFNDMYSNSETWFKRGQFCKYVDEKCCTQTNRIMLLGCRTIGTVESAGAGDCNTVKVTGTMGSTHKSDIVIDVWPVDSCNAAPRKN